MNSFIDLQKIMIIKGPNYPCLISHTDRSDKKERY